jgi:hypothetical protein
VRPFGSASFIRVMGGYGTPAFGADIGSSSMQFEAQYGFLYSVSSAAHIPCVQTLTIGEDRFNRRCAWQYKSDRCAFIVLAFEMDHSAQAVGDDIVGDVQAEADTALIAARGEERVESLAADIQAHAATIVGDDDLDIVRAGLSYRDIDATSLAIRKRMRDGVQDKICQHLPIGPGITGHGQSGLAIDIEHQIVPAQSRPQIREDLFGQIAQISSKLVTADAGDLAPLRVGCRRDTLPCADDHGCSQAARWQQSDAPY